MELLKINTQCVEFKEDYDDCYLSFTANMPHLQGNKLTMLLENINNTLALMVGSKRSKKIIEHIEGDLKT